MFFGINDCGLLNFLSNELFVFIFTVKLLKTVAFSAGKKNPATQKFFIHFFIENFIAKISLYALSWPKLNFGCYHTLEIIS